MITNIFKNVKKAFTLVELIVVIAIISILVTVAYVGYNRYVDQAYLTKEKQQVEEINRYLKAISVKNDFKHPETIEDVRNLLSEITNGEFKFTSYSNKYGYHYWFHIDSLTLYFEKYEPNSPLVTIHHESNDTSDAKLVFLSNANLTSTISKRKLIETTPEAFLYDTHGIVFLDVKGSKLAEVVQNFYNVKDYDSYLKLYQSIDKLSSYHNDIKDNLERRFIKTAFITDTGTYVYSNDDIESTEFVVFQNDLSIINNIKIDFKNTQEDINENNPLMKLNFDLPIPNTVETILPNGLLFTNDSNAKVIINKSINELQESNFSLINPNSTNVPLTIGNEDYIINNNTLKSVKNNSEIDINYSEILKLKDFKIRVKDYNRTDFALDEGGVCFEAYDFISNYEKNNKLVASKKVRWESSHPDIATVDENGCVTFIQSTLALLMQGEEYVSITAYPESEDVVDGDINSFKRTINIRISEITGFKVNLDNNPIENNTVIAKQLGDNDTIILQVYEYVTLLSNISHKTDIIFESSDEDVAAIDDLGVISLLNPGTTIISARLVHYDKEFKFTLNVAPKIEDYYKLSFEHTNKFMYRIGNKNPFNVLSLIEAIEEIDLNDVTYEFISAIDNTFLTSNTPLGIKQGTTNHEYKFEGTGVVKIKYRYQDPIFNTIDEKVLVVEVIDAWNVRTLSELTQHTSEDKVLLNDIIVPENGTVNVQVNNSTIHGNGFTINARKRALGTLRTIFTLNNGTIDNIIILDRYVPTMNFNSTSNGNDDNGNPIPNGYYNAPAIRVTSGSNYVYNSYISGGQAPIVAVANVEVVNSILEGGIANFRVPDGANNIKIVLDNVTTIQKHNLALPYGKDWNNPNHFVTVYGLGVLVESEDVKIEVRNDLIQYNWATSADLQLIPEEYRDEALAIYNKSDLNRFKHQILGTTYMNLGFVFYNHIDLDKNFIDNRPQNVKSKVTYELVKSNITILFIPVTFVSYSNNSTYSHDLVANNGDINRFNPSEVSYPLASNITKPRLYYNDSTNIELTYDEVNNKYSEYIVDLSNVLVKKYSNFDSYDIVPNSVLLNNSTNGVIYDSSTNSYKIILTRDNIGTNIIGFTIRDNIHFDLDGNYINESVDYQFYITIDIILGNLPLPTIDFVDPSQGITSVIIKKNNFTETDWAVGFFPFRNIRIIDPALDNPIVVDGITPVTELPQGITIRMVNMSDARDWFVSFRNDYTINRFGQLSVTKNELLYRFRPNGGQDWNDFPLGEKHAGKNIVKEITRTYSFEMKYTSPVSNQSVEKTFSFTVTAVVKYVEKTFIFFKVQDAELQSGSSIEVDSSYLEDVR